MDSMCSTFLLFFLVTAAVELETVSSKRLALHKAKYLFPSTELAKEQVQLDAALAAGAQAHPAKDPTAGEAKSFLAEEQQADTAAEAKPQPADGPMAAQVHGHPQGLAEEPAQPAEEPVAGAEAQSEEADAEEAHAEEQPQLDEEYMRGYFHGYINGRTDEYADAVAQTQLDETAAAQDDQQHAADSEAAEEVVDKVSDANAEKTHLDEARAALVAAQAPINNAQVAMAMEAFEADGRQQELIKAMEAMKKARMAAANSERERARAASVVAQAPIDDAPVAMAEEASDADKRRRLGEVMTAMRTTKKARMEANGATLQAVKKA